MISSGVVGAGGCRGRGEPVPVLSGADGLGTPQGRQLKCQPLTAKGSHPSKEGSGSQGSAGGRGEMPWLGAKLALGLDYTVFIFPCVSLGSPGRLREPKLFTLISK